LAVSRNTSATVGLRCPSCGRLDFHRVWRFRLAAGGSQTIECSCGEPKLELGGRRAGRDGRRKSGRETEYWLQFPCVVCEAHHFLTVSGREFWGPGLKTLSCPETGLELGHLGPEADVIRAAQEEAESLEDLVAGAESDDYFLNPPVMYQVLSHLHDVASNGKLYCRCGNPHLELNIFPDRLELHCPGCDGTSIIFAEDERDLALMKQTRVIEMSEGTFSVVHLTREPRLRPVDRGAGGRQTQKTSGRRGSSQTRRRRLKGRLPQDD